MRSLPSSFKDNAEPHVVDMAGVFYFLRLTVLTLGAQYLCTAALTESQNTLINAWQRTALPMIR